MKNVKLIPMLTRPLCILALLLPMLAPLSGCDSPEADEQFSEELIEQVDEARVEDAQDDLQGDQFRHFVCGSCDGSCGGQGINGNCWCDAACLTHNDCCEDLVEFCGS